MIEMLKKVTGMEEVSTEMVATALTMLHPLLREDDEQQQTNEQQIGDRQTSSKYYFVCNAEERALVEAAKEKKPTEVLIDKFGVQIHLSDIRRLRQSKPHVTNRDLWINGKVMSLIDTNIMSLIYTPSQQ